MMTTIMAMRRNSYQKKVPEGRYPRCHYNHRRKSKFCFDDVDSADDFISRHRLVGYVSYECPVCHGIHIGFKDNT